MMAHALAVTSVLVLTDFSRPQFLTPSAFETVPGKWRTSSSSLCFVMWRTQGVRRNCLQFAMRVISLLFWKKLNTMRQSFFVPSQGMRIQKRIKCHTMENLPSRPAALAPRSTWTNRTRIRPFYSQMERADARMPATSSSRTRVSISAVLARPVLLVTIVSIAITRTAASNQSPPEAAAAAEVGAEGLSWGAVAAPTWPSKKLFYFEVSSTSTFWLEYVLIFFWLSSADNLLADHLSHD